jgi:hypothetical protein
VRLFQVHRAFALPFRTQKLSRLRAGRFWVNVALGWQFLFLGPESALSYALSIGIPKVDTAGFETTPQRLRLMPEPLSKSVASYLRSRGREPVLRRYPAYAPGMVARPCWKTLRFLHPGYQQPHVANHRLMQIQDPAYHSGRLPARRQSRLPKPRGSLRTSSQVRIPPPSPPPNATVAARLPGCYEVSMFLRLPMGAAAGA